MLQQLGGGTAGSLVSGFEQVNSHDRRWGDLVTGFEGPEPVRDDPQTGREDVPVPRRDDGELGNAGRETVPHHGRKQQPTVPTPTLASMAYPRWADTVSGVLERWVASGLGQNQSAIDVLL